MANWYVRSGAAGAATGADWANAKLTLAAAFTAGAAGDTFFVSDDHAETQASAMNLSKGTAASPCFVYCVNRAGSVPPVSADLRTTATISTTGLNALTFGSTTSFIYYYGITFTAGDAANASTMVFGTIANQWHRLDACALVLGGSGSGARIYVGSAGNANQSRVEWNNTTVKFNATDHQIATQDGSLVWQNTANAIQGATLPTTLIIGLNASAVMTMEGVDLSALGSGKTIVGATAVPARVYINSCKLGASVTVAATPASQGSGETIVTRSDSGATNYRHEKYQYMGTQTVETTIVRTGGASDGTTPIAWKLVTTANSKWVLPFEALPIAIWNASTSSVTVTVYGIWGGGAVPNNDDIWMDIEYLGSALTPQGSFATSTKADNLATGSALTSDTSTWGGSTTKFKMTATFTPAQAGAIYIYLKAAKASTTFYIDPEVEVS